MLVDVTGNLSHKRPGWIDYLPLSFGSSLDNQDLLQAGPDTKGLIICSDLSLVSVSSSYKGGLPCPQVVSPPLERGESLVLGPRRGIPLDFNIPYILSPRHTYVQSFHPLLRWYPSNTGTDTYIVRVWGGGLDWQTRTTATELFYPEDAPALKPDESYYLTVTDAANRRSEQEQNSLDMSFAILPPAELDQIQKLLENVGKLDLEDQAIRILEAEIYAAYKLRADAIAILETLPAGENDHVIFRRLGDLYLEVGLYNEARHAYEGSLEGYRMIGDRAGEAHVLTGLGLAYRGDQDDTTGLIYLTQALSMYQAIGDEDGIIRIQGILSEMEITK